MSQDNGNSTLEMGTSDQVLVATKRKKTLTYVIGGVVMVAIIAVVVTLVVVFTGNDATAEPIVSTTEGPTTPISTTTPTLTTTTQTPVAPTTTEAPVTEPPLEPLDLESVINGVFSANSFNGTWSRGSEVLFRNANGDLVLYDVDTDSTLQLISNTSLTLQSSRVYKLSADQTHVVLAYNVLPVFRHSFLARYAVVDLVSGIETDILPSNLRSSEALLQNFVWGPSGTAFAFVYLNNIFYQPSLTSEPEQITTTGEFNVIYHGIPDWVYEEEVFGSNNAIYFSADGSMMVYVTFNDTNVRVMKVPHYGVPGSLDYQYTQHHEIRYPKTGTTNPTVSVTIRELVSGNNTVFNAPTDLQEPILKSVRFVDNDTIAVLWTNRVQNTLRILLCTEGQAACNLIYSYTENDGWIDNIPLFFNELGNAFVTILPQPVGGVSYRQIVQISQSTGTNLWTSSPRTSTANTVSEIIDWTEDDVIWYRATNVNDSTEQHIYTVNATGYISCFTCNIRRSDGGECLYNDGILSASRNRITVNCAGPDVPQIFIYDTDGNYVRTWDDNAELSALLENRTQSTTIRLTVPIADGQIAAAQLEVPSDYLTRTNVPLLVYVYGGPDISLVTKQWSLDWGSSLVSRWGIAVAQIDGRGSGLRDVSNLFAVNRRLGTVEIEDQINVTRYLQENLSWVDGNRTCIWGWSYGGYAASLALARGENVFRCAAAIAPVVDWRFYDSIYTERYMDLPSVNPQAYEVSSLLTEDLVEAYRNKSYFLIHGTADDNVHYQQAMLISRLLQRRNVYFSQMSYTDEDHGLSGVRPHLYHALETFLQEHML